MNKHPGCLRQSHLCCYPGVILILHLCSLRFSLDNKLYDHTALGAYVRWWQEERRKEFRINPTAGQKALSNKIPWYICRKTLDKILLWYTQKKAFLPFPMAVWTEMKVCSITTVINLIFAYVTYFFFLEMWLLCSAEFPPVFLILHFHLIRQNYFWQRTMFTSQRKRTIKKQFIHFIICLLTS